MAEPHDTSDYPLPGASENTPYPQLWDPWKNTLGESSDVQQKPHEHAGPITPGRPLPPHAHSATPERSTPDIASLTKSYWERWGSPNERSEWRFPGMDGVGYGVPGSAPRASQQHTAFDLSFENEPLDAQDELEGQPKDNRFLQPLRDMQAADDENSSSGDEDRPGAVRGGRSARGARRGRRGWKQFLKGTSHDPRVTKKLQQKGERPIGYPKGRKHVRKMVDPGPEFKICLQKANQAFLQADYDVAIEFAQEAVRINPEMFQAHNLLAESLQKAGREADSLAALMCGAHTVHDGNIWTMVAERTLDAAGDNRTEEDISQALFCYSNAVLIDRDDYAARAGKLELLMGRGEYNKARTEAKALVRMKPYDPDNKAVYAELCVMTGEQSELHRAKLAYDQAFEYHRVSSDCFGDQEKQWSDLNVYMDVTEKLVPPIEAITVLKRLSRWFLGRKDEVFWDQYKEDDREFDSGQERRGYVPEFQQGKASSDRAKYGDGLPLELRVKLGVLRLRQGMRYFEEAKKHFDFVLAFSDQIQDYYDMFFLVAEALSRSRLFDVALKYYEPILKVPDVATSDVHLGLADCYSFTGRYQEAADNYSAAIEKDPNNTQARVQLAKMYENMGEKAKAATTAAQATKALQKVMIRDRIEDTSLTPKVRAKPGPKPGSKRKDTGPRSARRAAYDAQRPDIQVAYATLQELSPAVEDGTADEDKMDEWFQCASHMVKTFRSLDIFYPKYDSWRLIGLGRWEHSSAKSLREMEAMRHRLQDKHDREQSEEAMEEVRDRNAPPKLHDAIPRDFHGIPFIEWHRVFVELALYFARTGEQEECYDLVNEGLFKANVFFHSPELHNISMAAALSCALSFNDTSTIMDLARKIISKGELRAGMSFHLLAAMCRLSYGPSNISAGPHQKFILRAVKVGDGCAMSKEQRQLIDWGTVTRFIARLLEKHGDAHGKIDPGVLLFYGHQVSTAPQSWSAIPYYLRVFAIQPNNLTTMLCMASVLIVHAMKRQSENRHYNIAQGLGFMYRYYELRTSSGMACDLQEAEWNMGRVWHMIGLTHLAMPCYEKVMQLSPAVREELGHLVEAGEDVEDYAFEAAYTLRNLYVVTGNMVAAKKITEEWLVL